MGDTSTAASERVVYWVSGSAPAWRALIALKEKNLPHVSRLLDFSKGEHKSPEVLAINPRGQVPTFRDGSVVVNESLAIIQYLEDTYPQPALMPNDISARAKVLQRFHEANVAQLKVIEAVMIKLFGKGTPEESQVFAKKVESMKAEFALWDGYLSSDTYVAGPSFSIADIAFIPLILTVQRFGAKYIHFPNIKNYADRVKFRTSVVETWPPHWKDTPGKDWLPDF